MKIVIFSLFSIYLITCPLPLVAATQPFHEGPDQSISTVISDYPNQIKKTTDDAGLDEDNEKDLDYWEEDFEKEGPGVSDPLAPFNRAMYHFNDKFYFWLLKPASVGYKAITPEPLRISVRNFFSHLLFPQRFTNCIFQANFKGARIEFSRFVLNTTIGLGGLFDPAAKGFGLQKYEKDLGQTLGAYGLKQGVFINWPILGPSTLRDSVGIIGDFFLDPISYLISPEVYFEILSYKTVNNTSLRIGDYEALKDAAIDPYIGIRDFYIQYRQQRVKEK